MPFGMERRSEPLDPSLGAMAPTRVPHRALRGIRYSVPIIVFIQTFTSLSGLSQRAVLLTSALALLVAVGWGIAMERRRGDVLDQVGMLAVIGASVWLGALTGAGQFYPAAYGALFVAPFWYGLPEGLAVSITAIAAVGLGSGFIGNDSVSAGVGNALGAAFFGVAAWFWGRVLRGSQRNSVLLEELRESRDAEQRSAVVAERARLARELHDVLAHTLSSLALHLESTRVLAKSRDVDPEVQSRIERAVALARDGLEEARDAVGTLRDDALPGADRLPALVADFGRLTGVEAHFEQVGTPAPLTPEASVALFRSAQEALTNIGKHAHPSRVDVRLEWDGGLVTLTVTDDGGGPNGQSTLPGGGNGLRGMRERAELAGGQLDAGPAGPGFAVELKLPA